MERSTTSHHELVLPLDILKVAAAAGANTIRSAGNMERTLEKEDGSGKLPVEALLGGGPARLRDLGGRTWPSPQPCSRSGSE
jgi:hypothetical protein